ncbi:hypothetical protein, partial [Rhodococcus qingshengii]|uniref:hypothetical protein n=1 Tax=Rhodococcus qingshengii TaxID=334542 RepID=UPI0036DED590
MSDVTTQLAKAICEGRGHAWGNGLPNEYWESHAKPALKFFAAAGRLIPAGGMALTAEQVEDVRRVMTCGGGLAFEAAHARLRALFPATEPAEDAPCAICNVNETNHAGVSYYHPFTTELGPFDDEGNDRPTPAEPAAVEVDPRAESQAACLYAKLLTAGEDPGLIFQAVLWAYERVKSNPEIMWLEDLYQAWESRASTEATINSTLNVPAPAESAEEEC